MTQKIRRRAFIKTTSAFSLGLGASQTAGFASILNTKKPEMLLVEKGIIRAPIIIAPDAPEENQRVAGELAEYIEKISGAKPDVLSNIKSVPKSAIWIGVQPQLSKIFQGFNVDFQHPQEILIACNGRHLLIAGRDYNFNNVQIEYGTANAVYTFLQKYLDVRWLWPGEMGEDIICRDTINIPSFTYRYHPVILRRDVIRLSARSEPGDKWARLQRLKLDSLKGSAGGHAFTTWWERFHKDHPEWFALQPDGTRSGYPGPKTVKMCLSNPEVWDQWLLDAEEAIKKNPALSMIMAGENDSFSTGLCVCASCREWDHPEGDPFTYNWEGHREEYVIMSNRYITFCNHVARKLKERFPDRDNLYVQALAYGPSLKPPIDIELEDNIIVSYVGFFPIIGKTIRKQQKEQFKAWSQVAKNMLYRPNFWYFTGGIWGLPDPALNNTIEDFHFLAEQKCIGLFVDTAQEHWSTQGPQYYLMTQLAWDPLQDGQVLMEDYYRRGFGKAAGKIKAYWNLMEEANDRVISDPDYKSGSANRYIMVSFFEKVYTEDFFKRVDNLIQQAELLVKNEPEIYRRRIDFVRTGLEFTRLMMANLPLMTRVRDSGGKDKDAVNKVTENWKTINKLHEHAGQFALNYNSIMLKMQSKSYMGLMEDYFGPPAEKFLKEGGIEYIENPPDEPDDI